MKSIGMVLVTCILLSALVSGAWAVPALPCAFWGSVTINGQPAAVGTTVTALIDGDVRGQITVTETGKYGDYAELMEKLVVEGTEEDVGKTIRFMVAGMYAPQTASFVSGDGQSLDLSLTTGGGTSGGGSSSGGSSYATAMTTSPTTEPTTEPTAEQTGGTDGLLSVSADAGASQGSMPEDGAPSPTDTSGEGSFPWTALGGVFGLVVVVGGVYFWWNGKN